ncbi:MAG TPA: hypothetical protein VFF73_37270, partial [Planctomycetota bacterium]|nr:hypothetical protein [Planctomycetota bacterium]
MRLAASLAVLVLAASPALAQPAMTDGGVIRDAGVPYTMQRETQGKLFFVDNTWWGAFGGTGGIDFYRFDASSKTWAKQTFTGAHVTSDSNSRSECHWDGTNLLILYSVGMAATGDGPLYLAAYTYSAPNFVPIGGFPVQVVASGAVDKNWSVVEDTNQRLWISYQTYAQYGVLSSTGTGPSGWTSFHAPIFMGNASTGVDNDLGSHGLVAFNGNIGLIWTECFNAPDNHTKFSWRADSNTDLSGSSFSPVELCQEDATYTMLTDDHVCVRSFEGQVWCVSKSNYDQNQGGFPRFTLMRRDLSGNWSHWTVKTINPTPDYSSRPIMAIDATNRLLYFFWIDSGIQYDSTPIDNPGTFSSIGTLILEAGS